MEIDEEDLAKRPAKTKLRVFAAGSSTNVATWFLVLLIFANFTLVISPLYQSSSSGVLVTGLSNNGGAQAAGIPQWSVITQLNGTKVEQPIDLAKYLLHINQTQHPNTIVVVTLGDGSTRDVRTSPAPGNSTRAFMGVSTFQYFAPRWSRASVQFPFQLYSQLNWLLIILLGVGIVNMLPMLPFDGDRYFDTLLSVAGLKNTKRARTAMSIVSLGLLGSNLILSYILFGTVFPS